MPSEMSMFDKPCIFVPVCVVLIVISLGLIVGAIVGLGIASQVAGTVILTAAGYEGYNIGQTAILMGGGGGIGAYVLVFACCALIMRDRLKIFVLFPILLTPLLFLGGVLTGICGFYGMKREHLADNLISQGYGYTQASRAGAVGGAVVGGGSLLILQVFAGCYYLFSLIRSRPTPQQESSEA
ncbi:hypothetical protein BJ165DRAFT_1487000 [Panaeolus papilionaceus]|nr:hypothetical protein BJ165DRAFT_1487000 [Panaeolus papilionaceus]